MYKSMCSFRNDPHLEAKPHIGCGKVKQLVYINMTSICNSNPSPRKLHLHVHVPVQYYTIAIPTEKANTCMFRLTETVNSQFSFLRLVSRSMMHNTILYGHTFTSRYVTYIYMYMYINLQKKHYTFPGICCEYKLCFS